MNRPNPDQPANSENRYVSTAQVAQALGVSVTTVKRWVDDNILPAHRTAGGHRKLLMADVLRLVREGNLPQADLSRLLPKATVSATDPSELLRQMSDAIRHTDTELIRSIILGAYNAGTPIETIGDRVISPALMNVGHEWAGGRMEVMQEHRITQACVSALYELKAFMRLNADQDRPVAVGGAPEHDHYILPTLLAKLTLLDSGWDAINLGPHTPLSAFHTAIEELSPQLIWLSVTHLDATEKFISEYKQVYKLAEDKGIAVALGGRALTDPIRSRIPYTTFGDGFSQLSAFARSLYRRPQRPKRGRPPGLTTKRDDEANDISDDYLDSADTPEQAGPESSQS
jgi:MerR family transcriptional regulator, light-induced transcriptional regulator